jgi:flagellin-like hook-associated protein FlgL
MHGVKYLHPDKLSTQLLKKLSPGFNIHSASNAAAVLKISNRFTTQA